MFKLQQFNLTSSGKDIPIPSRTTYMKKLISQTETFLKSVRWKAFWSERAGNNDEQTIPNHRREITTDFKSTKTPPQHELLKPFERDMYNPIGGIEFRKVHDPALQKMGKEAKRINNSDMVIVNADKTGNKYEVSASDYKKLLHENITRDYKMDCNNKLASINQDTLDHARNLDIEDRMECPSESNAFLTIKDHKEGFPNYRWTGIPVPVPVPEEHFCSSSGSGTGRAFLSRFRYRKSIFVPVPVRYRKSIFIPVPVPELVPELEQKCSSGTGTGTKMLFWYRNRNKNGLPVPEPEFRSIYVPNNIKCRVINPASNNLGKVSKRILDKVNNACRDATEVNQWKSTQDVLHWFTHVHSNNPTKAKARLLQFDICEFYPSISEDLLRKSLLFAKNHTFIEEEEVSLIMACRKSVLFNSGNVWTKKDRDFDVTMGAQDGAEIAELTVYLPA